MTLLLLLMSATTLPEMDARLFNEASAAYEQGDFGLAVEKYTQLQTARYGRSPALLYNLGNAWLRQGAPGRAILHYEAALMLDPNFEWARRNLEEALRVTERYLPAPDPRLVDGRLLARYYPITPALSLILVHALVGATVLLLALRHFLAGARLRWLSRLTPVAALVLYALTVAANGMQADAPQPAVTLVSEAPVYFSMRESEQPRFLLYEGDRVLIDRVEGDWLRVTAHGGERGWTRKDNLGLVRYVIM